MTNSYPAPSPTTGLTREKIMQYAAHVAPLITGLSADMRDALIMIGAGYDARHVAREIPDFADEHAVHRRVNLAWKGFLLPCTYLCGDGREIIREALSIAGSPAMKQRNWDDDILNAAAKVEALDIVDRSLLDNAVKFDLAPARLFRLRDKLGLLDVPDHQLKKAFTAVLEVLGAPVAPPKPVPQPEVLAPPIVAANEEIPVVEPQVQPDDTDTAEDVPSSELQPPPAAAELESPEMILEPAHPEPMEEENMFPAKVALLIEGLNDDGDFDLLEFMSQGLDDEKLAESLGVDRNGVLRRRTRLYKRLSLPESLDSEDEGYRERTTIEAFGLYKTKHPEEADSAPMAAQEQAANTPATETAPEAQPKPVLPVEPAKLPEESTAQEAAPKSVGEPGDEVKRVAELMATLVRDNRFSTKYLRILEHLSNDVDNLGIATAEGTTKTLVVNRISNLYAIFEICSGPGTRVGREGRHLLRDGYKLYVAHAEAGATADESLVPASEPLAPPQAKEPAKPVAELQPVLEPEVSAPEQPPEPESAIESESAPAEEGSEAAPASADNALVVVPTPAETGTLIVASQIELRDPGTVRDSEILDPRSPSFRRDKLALLQEGYQLEGFQTLVLDKAIIPLPIFVKRR